MGGVSEMHHTKDKGDIGLTYVIADLVKDGWFVSLPIQEHAPYDLIATKENIVRRVQVKYRSWNRMNALEAPVFNTWGNATRGNVNGKIYDKNSIDVFVITNAEVIAYLPISLLEGMTGKISVRQLGSEKRKKNRRYIEDFNKLA